MGSELLLLVPVLGQFPYQSHSWIDRLSLTKTSWFRACELQLWPELRFIAHNKVDESAADSLRNELRRGNLYYVYSLSIGYGSSRDLFMDLLKKHEKNLFFVDNFI